MLLDGPMNGVAFLAYVEQVLVPTLVPGDQVRTTCPPTRSPVSNAIEAAGATRLLRPPYSPDFNPIEQAFSKLATIRASASLSSTSAVNRSDDVVSSAASRLAVGFFVFPLVATVPSPDVKYVT